MSAAAADVHEVIDWQTGTIAAAGRLTVHGADLIRGAALSLHRAGHAQIRLDLRGLCFGAAPAACRGRPGPAEPIVTS